MLLMHIMLFPPPAEEKILYLTPEQEKDKSHFTDKEVFIKSRGLFFSPHVRHFDGHHFSGDISNKSQIITCLSSIQSSGKDWKHSCPNTLFLIVILSCGPSSDTKQWSMLLLLALVGKSKDMKQCPWNKLF